MNRSMAQIEIFKKGVTNLESELVKEYNEKIENEYYDYLRKKDKRN